MRPKAGEPASRGSWEIPRSSQELVLQFSGVLRAERYMWSLRKTKQTLRMSTSGTHLHFPVVVCVLSASARGCHTGPRGRHFGGGRPEAWSPAGPPGDRASASGLGHTERLGDGDAETESPGSQDRPTARAAQRVDGYFPHLAARRPGQGPG